MGQRPLLADGNYFVLAAIVFQAACLGITSRSIARPIDAVQVVAILDIGPVFSRGAKVPARRAAVSAVMPRFSFTIRLMRFAGTRMALRQTVDADLFILQVFQQNPARVNRLQSLFISNRRFRHRSVLSLSI
jgi:hypothetical protein